jgi:hypothetical protein
MLPDLVTTGSNHSPSAPNNAHLIAGRTNWLSHRPPRHPLL